jgi:hypothetical protein
VEVAGMTHLMDMEVVGLVLAVILLQLVCQ